MQVGRLMTHGDVPHKALRPGISCANSEAGLSHSSYPNLLGREN